MSSKGTRRRIRFLCLDCKVDTGKIKEFYYVYLPLWLSACPENQGMLCIGCMESRIGRRLYPEDFPPVSLNTPMYPKSQRLMERLGYS